MRIELREKAESERLDGVAAGHREKIFVRASRLRCLLFLSRALKSGEATNSLLFVSSESFHLANFSTI